jgi:hypothetical protein
MTLLGDSHRSKEIPETIFRLWGCGATAVEKSQLEQVSHATAKIFVN